MVVLLVACGPDWGSGSGLVGPTGARVVVTTTPEAALDAAPSVLRLRVAMSDATPMDPARVALVRGTVTRSQLSALSAGTPPDALAARLVEAERWSDEDAAVLAPRSRLVAGERYSLALFDRGQSVALRVQASEDTWLERRWPPRGESATENVGVWCGDLAFGSAKITTVLDPGGAPASVVRGAVLELATRCLRVEVASSDARDKRPPQALVAPPELEIDGRMVALEPIPLERDVVPGPPVEPLECDAFELPLAQGCASVYDAFAVVRTPSAPLLWAIGGEGLDDARTTSGESFVLAPLAVATDVLIRAATMDVAGRTAAGRLATRTSYPVAHLVIDEVYANPIGPEPAEEWIEIVNAGLAPAMLSRFSLVDVAGETLLPDLVLPSGARALIVREDFVADDGFDPKPAAGTPLVRVPKLGYGGLANMGEPLRLRSEGRVVSSFPGLPANKPGRSAARTTPLAPDDSASSFVHDASPTPGAPNGG
jgi:hypothetical protein